MWSKRREHSFNSVREISEKCSKQVSSLTSWPEFTLEPVRGGLVLRRWGWGEVQVRHLYPYCFLSSMSGHQYIITIMLQIQECVVIAHECRGLNMLIIKKNYPKVIIKCLKSRRIKNTKSRGHFKGLSSWSSQPEWRSCYFSWALSPHNLLPEEKSVNYSLSGWDLSSPFLLWCFICFSSSQGGNAMNVTYLVIPDWSIHFLFLANPVQGCREQVWGVRGTREQLYYLSAQRVTLWPNTCKVRSQ